ncbi:hypothetical protein [Streptobacillus moniliformis]|uniref:hypothetical protein n=1 Tax=Streptobacillus moniliformis TaxID=34105 RepID=UPI000ADB1524|nr:hypothetical protein [Streptobacillus moniliformis]
MLKKALKILEILKYFVFLGLMNYVSIEDIQGIKTAILMFILVVGLEMVARVECKEFEI